jgi:hypothetical protein
MAEEILEEDGTCSCIDCEMEREAVEHQEKVNDFDEEDEEYDGDYSGKDVWHKYEDFAIQLSNKLGFSEIDSGSFRVAYGRKSVVIKVPMNEDGEIDNRVEAAAWRKYKNNPTDRGLYLAPCRLLPNGCLMMVQVNFDYTPAEADERWSAGHWSQKVESHQVGKYHGRIVAYDYALNVSERMAWEEEWEVVGHVFRRRFA